MAEVDPEDDSADRWIVWRYRYDPSRRERRNTVVAAFDNEAEFLRRIAEVHVELHRLQTDGKAERAEHVSGALHAAGSRTDNRARRASWRALLSRRSRD